MIGVKKVVVIVRRGNKAISYTRCNNSSLSIYI